MQLYIKGNFRKAIFTTTNGYMVGLFKVRETNDESLDIYVNKTITFTGYFHELNIDDTYLFYGVLKEHNRYGLQYEVDMYEKVKPTTDDELILFFSSELFKGLGLKMAKQIVDIFHEKAISQILDNYENLLIIPKMTIKKAKTIHDSLAKYEHSTTTILYLTNLGFTMKVALKIFNHYKDQTINVIEHNIYDLIDINLDISFLEVDKISLKLDYKRSDERRLKALIIYSMMMLSGGGDTYAKLDSLTKEVSKYYNDINKDEVYSYLLKLNQEYKVVIEDDKYFLKALYDAEVNISNKLKRLNNIKSSNLKNIDYYIDTLEQSLNIKYNNLQKQAIKNSLKHNISIITGGPGTGKTTIIKAIINIYQNMLDLDNETLKNDIALLAPTGKASRKMSLSSILPASTIHRFLKWNKDTDSFLLNEHNKASVKFIIVDEVSMIDTYLFSYLLDALLDNVKIVLVGDYHQLPSVGAGEVLKDLIDSNKIITTHLTELYRQDENSYINALAHEIKNQALSNTYLEMKDDYNFICSAPLYVKNNIMMICQKALERGYDSKNIQVLAPMYKGENGIDSLNQSLQALFNPPDSLKHELSYGDVIFRENDKVLQLTNMVDEGVFNGDIGFIKEILDKHTSSSGQIEVIIEYDGNIVTYAYKDLINIKHGYAISIHKAQGSEFDMVIIPFVASFKRMLYKRLIYTAVSRAKKKLILIGDSNAFTYGVMNDFDNKRLTNLKKLMETE